MIFRRTLLREFANLAIAVFLSLFLIALTTRLIRLLGHAAGGKIPSDAVVAFLGFSALNVLPILLSLTLFITVLLALNRAWRDSEMVIWFSSGLSLTAWLRPVLMFAAPLVLVIAMLSLVIAPWSAQMAEQYRSRLDSRDDLSRVEPGTFGESRSKERVFFVESVAGDKGSVQNVFVNSVQHRRTGVMMSERGFTEYAPNGDRLLNTNGTSFLGYEVDAVGPGSPANLRRLAHSPATPANANFSDMTIYRAASGATVFSTGSINWSTVVPQVQQITRNVLARMTTGAFTDAPPVRPSLPAPFTARNIGPVGRAGFVSLAGPQSFTINGAGQTAFHGQDALYYVSRPLTGDGEIVARVTAVEQYYGNRAGVMIRESMAPEAKYVSLVARPTGSHPLEGVDFKLKAVAGAKPTIAAGTDQPFPEWLKLTRAGNVFTAFVSPDGARWTRVGSATVAMSPQVYIGTSVAGARDGVWMTASFDNVSVTG